MKLNNIQHIFFDLDHTLWDFDKNSALAFEFLFEEEKIDIGLQEFLEVYLPINFNYWELYRNNQVSKENLRIGRLKETFELLKLEVSAEIITVLSDKYIQFLPNYNYLLEDTVAVLKYLQPKYKLHIITNGFEEIQHHKLVNSKIASYFSTVTTSEEAGVKKPHLQIFEKALQKSNAHSKNSLMIGDNYEADVQGAINAGMQSVYFDYYQKNEILETLQIQKLNELRKYL
jgi:putative hydrolase of the HAD superfamily